MSNMEQAMDWVLKKLINPRTDAKYAVSVSCVFHNNGLHAHRV
jgi:hypothetical protein